MAAATALWVEAPSRLRGDDAADRPRRAAAAQTAGDGAGSRTAGPPADGSRSAGFSTPWAKQALRAGAAALILASAPFGGAAAADPETADMLAKLGRPGDFTLAPPDVTEEAPSGFYARLDAGYAAATGGAVQRAGLPTGLDLSGSGWSVGGGLGYRLNPFLRGEVSIDYLDLGASHAGPFAVSGSATVALASLYWDVATIAGFTPYLSAGAGFAIDGLDAAPAALGTGGNAWQFAWSVGAGVSYAIDAGLSIDLGYRYVDLGAPSYASGLTVSDAAAHQIRIGVRYMLN